MTFPEIKSILTSNHFYPSEQVLVGKKKQTVTGLVIGCPSIILMDEKVEMIKKVLEENNITGYKVYGLKNKGEIYIEKDRPNNAV